MVPDRLLEGLSANGELKERFPQIIGENVEVIASNQHPQTGLFPAATLERRVEKDHYQDAWIRDTSAVVKSLLYSRKFLPEEDLKDELAKVSLRSINGILEVVDGDPWRRAFGQEIFDEGSYTHLTDEAPPVHLKTSGEVCHWPRQNQPDSWGVFLIAASLAHEQGIFEPDSEQRKTITSIVQYLTHIKAEKFESSSMWEDREVKNPPSVSTALIIEEGLKRIRKLYTGASASNFDRELVRIIERRINAIDIFIEANYPADFTWIEGHQSRTDLATLVAFGYGDYGRLPLNRYMFEANRELGNGELPGKIRFRGDPYYRRDGKEAVWFMALPLEAIVFLRKSLRARIAGNMDEAVRFRTMGLPRLERAIKIGECYGFYPELFTWENGDLVPNENDLLWNRALIIDASVMGLETSKF